MVDSLTSALPRSFGVEQHDLATLPQFDAQYHKGMTRLLRIIALCWLASIPISYLLDQVFVGLSSAPRSLPLLYYCLQMCPPLIVFGLAASPPAQHWLGRAFLPIVICCMSVLPLLITPLVTPLDVGPITGVRGLISLRFSPVVLIGLLLVAWNYSWKYVLLLNVMIPALIIVPALLHLTVVATTIGVALIQAMGFLTISYCVYTLVVRLKRQSAELHEANRHLRHYASTLESLTISRERNRVARELHDTLAHTLSSLTVQLETIKAYWERDPQAARAMIETALMASRGGLQETRRALDALRASPIDDFGLRIALNDMVESIAEVANIQLELLVPEELPLLDPASEQAIYRIAQEAVTNVAHHAQAQRVAVQLSYTDQALLMRVQDNGCGFDMQQGQQAGHFGLAGMHERARLIGAHLKMTSAFGAGTLIELTLPLDGRRTDACADLR